MLLKTRTGATLPHVLRASSPCNDASSGYHNKSTVLLKSQCIEKTVCNNQIYSKHVKIYMPHLNLAVRKQLSTTVYAFFHEVKSRNERCSRWVFPLPKSQLGSSIAARRTRLARKHFFFDLLFPLICG